ncbi:MAG TPA: PoNe immunity protein domain-containing protein [Gallionellaceae bacterium]|nr:PoNe immunity protein domain-containing protein [Gallionellaceae bacterium]
MGNQAYWDKWTNFCKETINKDLAQLEIPSKNLTCRPQFVWGLSKEYPRWIITRYSRGDPIRDLNQHFTGLMDTWELSNKLTAELNIQLRPSEGWDHRHLLIAPQPSDDPRSHSDPRAWVFDLANLNHYNWCFWLVGLALSLEILDEQWNRLLVLIGGEGEDILLDRVIASRASGRRIGTTLLHKKPYARLLKAINATKESQADLLKDFVDHWYAELARKGKDELWWYIYGDSEKNPLEMGSYFGRWCIEAVAAVKAFGLDDSLCLGHEHYPGDLLRPDGPSTHPDRQEKKSGWLSRLIARNKNSRGQF